MRIGKPGALEKRIWRTRHRRDQGVAPDIESQMTPRAASAGADVLVVGSAVYSRSASVQERIGAIPQATLSTVS